MAPAARHVSVVIFRRNEQPGPGPACDGELQAIDFRVQKPYVERLSKPLKA
jgi:hypothetical protein